MSKTERTLLADLMKKLIKKVSNMGDITGYYSVIISQTNKVMEFKRLDEPGKVWEGHHEARIAIVFIDRPPHPDQTSLDSFIRGTQPRQPIYSGTKNIEQSAHIIDEDDYRK